MVFRRDKDPHHRSMRGDEGSYLSPDIAVPEINESDEEELTQPAGNATPRNMGARALPPVVEWGPKNGNDRRQQLRESES